MAQRALTVGQLREVIANLPDSVEVVISTDGWYDNIGGVELPNDENIVCVTLHRSSPDTVGNYDVRQHATGVIPAEVR